VAIITTRGRIFNGRRFALKVRVNRDGLFRIAWPHEIVDLFGPPVEAIATTQDEALVLWENRVREFTEARTTKRKVIRYRVKIQGKFWVEEGGHWFVRSDVPFGCGLGLLIWAGVYEETCVTRDNAEDVYSYDAIPNDLPLSIRNPGNFGIDRHGQRRDTHSIPWSEKGEAFFSRAASLLEKLSVSLADMTSNSKEFAELVETAGPMLLSPASGDARADDEPIK